MHGMQLSLFADTDLTVAVAPTPTARRSVRPSLATRMVAMHAAQDPDSHAVAVDAVLRNVTPRIVRIARLFIPSCPVAHADVDDLTQEVLLEVAASVHWAPCGSDDQVQAWLSALAMRVLHDLWRAATQDANDHRDALAQFAVELEPDASVPHPDDTDDGDDGDHEPSGAAVHARAA